MAFSGAQPPFVNPVSSQAAGMGGASPAGFLSGEAALGLRKSHWVAGVKGASQREHGRAEMPDGPILTQLLPQEGPTVPLRTGEDDGHPDRALDRC